MHPRKYSESSDRHNINERRDEWMDPELRPLYIWSLSWDKKNVTLTLRHRLGGEGWFPADNSVQIVLYQNINISKKLYNRVSKYFCIFVSLSLYICVKSILNSIAVPCSRHKINRVTFIRNLKSLFVTSWDKKKCYTQTCSPKKPFRCLDRQKNGPTVPVWGVVNCYSSNTHLTVLFVAGLTKVLETSKRNGCKLLGIMFNRDLTFTNKLFMSQKS